MRTGTPDRATFDAERYVSLTTYRRDGTPVATPVWFAMDGGALVVLTDASSGKARRIGANAAVVVTPCDARGKVHGDAWAATARRLEPSAHARVHQLLARKYGLVFRAFVGWTALDRRLRRRPAREEALLEVSFVPAEAGPAAQA